MGLLFERERERERDYWFCVLMCREQYIVYMAVVLMVMSRGQRMALLDCGARNSNPSPDSTLLTLLLGTKVSHRGVGLIKRCS